MLQAPSRKGKALTRATCVATRSPLCALRSTGVRGAASPARASSIGLPQSYPSGAPEGDSNSAPVSTTGWSRHRSRHAMTTRGETASRSAAAPPCQPHTTKRISRSTIRESSRSSPCALHSSRNAPATMGGSRRVNRARSRRLACRAGAAERAHSRWERFARSRVAELPDVAASARAPAMAHCSRKVFCALFN